MLKPYQSSALLAVENRKVQRGIIALPTGCLSGETIVGINRHNTGSRIKLSSLFRLTQRTNYNKITPTFIRSNLGDRVGLCQVIKVVKSGEKITYQLTLQNGKQIRATKDHEILTSHGFVPLADINLTEKIICEDTNPKTNGRIKKSYKQTQGLKFHPFAGNCKSAKEGRLYRVSYHRLVYEAKVNNITTDKLIKMCRTDKKAAQALTYFDPKIYAVHHIDDNCKNNSPENLALLTHNEHFKLHGDSGGYSHFGYGQLEESRILCIKKFGKEMTYDVVCEHPYHNFVANGMIVHNCGKGFLAGSLKDPLKTDRILYLAHREELIEQLAGHVEREMGWGYVGIEQANNRASDHCKTVIASVPTLTTNKCRRLEKFRPGRFGAIVCDEAHHATADTYIKIWQYFGLLDENKKKTPNPLIPLIGLTATPSRGDNVGLSNIFDEILYQMSLFDAIQEGWLVPVCAYTVRTGTSLDNVRTRMGEFVEQDLANAVDTDARNEAVFDACRKNAKGLKTLIFCVNVQHACDMAACFNAKGVNAQYISGDMPNDKRKGVFDWFAKTPGAVLTNCQLVTEGVDIPSVEAVVMAKPTKSKTLYAQCLGRGSRLAAGAWDIQESIKLGKDKCILLDISDSIRDAGRRAVTVGDIFGAPLPNKELAGVDMNKEIKAQQQAIEEARQGNYKALGNMSGTEAIAIELFAMPADLPGSDMAWLDYGDSFRLPIAKYGDITIESDTLDRWSALFFDKENHRTDPIFRDIPEQAKIIQLVEKWVRTKCSDSLRLVNKSAGWRKQGPSEAQLNLCRRLRIEVPAGASKGDVSMAIDRRLNQKNSKKCQAASGGF